ncbi:hypothetical protein [Catenuloplanes indicus]|uniref:Uncharacterized protein n=1 Tax=Catenuloplanes indicus TaxID=137267 RepID=A0AAE3VVD7_9ACTN|nr:hypothetical protein [Catenuloplanes indicus]MDQ0364733.1 hypothetical protein [Catenuloplanes indicus]
MQPSHTPADFPTAPPRYTPPHDTPPATTVQGGAPLDDAPVGEAPIGTASAGYPAAEASAAGFAPVDDAPVEALPIARVNVGMSVVDSLGDAVGTVTAVQMPGTDVRPDVAAGIAENLVSTGYLRIDSEGLFTTDVYASGDQIAASTEGEPGVVTLNASHDDLHRAA